MDKITDSDLINILAEAFAKKTSWLSPDCPDPEVLMDLIERKREVPHCDALLAHILGCGHCFPLFESVRQLWGAREPARYPLARAVYGVRRTVEAGQSRLRAWLGAAQGQSRRLAEQIWNRPGPSLAWARSVVSEEEGPMAVPLAPATWRDLRVLAQVGWEAEGFSLHLALVQAAQPQVPVSNCRISLWHQGQEVDQTVTSAEGFADFYGLRASTYGLTFSTAPGWLWEVQFEDG